MKNLIQIRNLLIGSTLALTLAGLAWLPTAGFAQEKGATQLMQHKTAAAVETASPAVMSCPKCKDALVTVTEKTAKTVMPEIKRQVLSHQCPGCANKEMTEGHGKAKTTKTIHTCAESANNTASCCAKK
jgi:uncharacterized protein with PIN domain